MNQELSTEALALSQVYIDSYSILAYDIASQYVASPELLRVDASFERGYAGTTNHSKPVIAVRFPATHTKLDFGKLIGGKGTNFRALRLILREYGSRFKHDVELEIIEPIGPQEGKGPPYVEDTSWDEAKNEEFRKRLESIAERVFGWPVPVRAYSTWDITHLLIETGEVPPEVVAAFKVLWIAIGRTHGRQLKLNAEAPRAVANG